MRVEEHKGDEEKKRRAGGAEGSGAEQCGAEAHTM